MASLSATFQAAGKAVMPACRNLTHKPDNWRGQSPDKMYLKWSFCSIESGHAKEVAAVAKKFICSYKHA